MVGAECSTGSTGTTSARRVGHFERIDIDSAIGRGECHAAIGCHRARTGLSVGAIGLGETLGIGEIGQGQRAGIFLARRCKDDGHLLSGLESGNGQHDICPVKLQFLTRIYPYLVGGTGRKMQSLRHAEHLLVGHKLAIGNGLIIGIAFLAAVVFPILRISLHVGFVCGRQRSKVPRLCMNAHTRP